MLQRKGLSKKCHKIKGIAEPKHQRLLQAARAEEQKRVQDQVYGDWGASRPGRGSRSGLAVIRRQLWGMSFSPLPFFEIQRWHGHTRRSLCLGRGSNKSREFIQPGTSCFAGMEKNVVIISFLWALSHLHVAGLCHPKIFKKGCCCCLFVSCCCLWACCCCLLVACCGLRACHFRPHVLWSCLLVLAVVAAAAVACSERRHSERPTEPSQIPAKTRQASAAGILSLGRSWRLQGYGEISCCFCHIVYRLMLIASPSRLLLLKLHLQGPLGAYRVENRLETQVEAQTSSAGISLAMH